MGSNVEYLIQKEKLILQENGTTFGKIEDRKVLEKLLNQLINYNT
jgi:hypothetical protein